MSLLRPRYKLIVVKSCLSLYTPCDRLYSRGSVANKSTKGELYRIKDPQISTDGGCHLAKVVLT